MSPSVATAGAAGASGAIGDEQVACHLAHLVGRRHPGRADRRAAGADADRPPRADWRPRRLHAGPAAAGWPRLLLRRGHAAGGRWDEQRAAWPTFERERRPPAPPMPGRGCAAACMRCRRCNSARRAAGDTRPRRRCAWPRSWWLRQPLQLQAMGYSERVPLAARCRPSRPSARAQGLTGYRVFDRDGGAAGRRRAEVVAIRHIEPPAGNAAALGVNVLSIPAARAAILSHARAAASRRPRAGFRLTQVDGDETGVVIYQALYRGDPANEAAARACLPRRASSSRCAPRRRWAGWRRRGPAYLRWCLVDTDPARRRAAPGRPAPAARRRAPAERPASTAARCSSAGAPLRTARLAPPRASVPGASGAQRLAVLAGRAWLSAAHARRAAADASPGSAGASKLAVHERHRRAAARGGASATQPRRRCARASSACATSSTTCRSA